MNIDEYRELVAKDKEAQNQDSEPKEQPAEPVLPSTETTEPTPQPTSTEPLSDAPVVTPPAQAEPTTPQTIEIDGQAVDVEELKNGYLRQSDYTRKTQELAQLRKEANQAKELARMIQTNPELAQQFNVPYVDPNQMQIQELEKQMADISLQNEVYALKEKFNIEKEDLREVLQTAYDERINNLETAYHVVQSRKQKGNPSVDVNALKEEIRQSLLSELQSNVDTQSIITTGKNSAPSASSQPSITKEELKVAEGFGMKPDEFIKWRDSRK